MTRDDDNGDAESGVEGGPFHVDRRDHRRVDLDASVTIRSPHAGDGFAPEDDTFGLGGAESGLAESAEFMVDGEGEDISVGGMYVITEERLPAGATVEVEFEIPEVDQDFDLAAEVRWTRRMSEQRNGHVWGVGLEFEEVEEDERQVLEDFVLERLSA